MYLLVHHRFLNLDIQNQLILHDLLPCFGLYVVFNNMFLDVRHINANIVASRTPKDIEVIKAIGAYNGENILVIKTMAVSPGRPTNENTGTNQSEI